MSKLAALLNMLSSDFDGERANAARMIANMAKANGKTVADFVMSPQTIYRDRIVEKTVYRDRPGSEGFSPHDDYQRARKKPSYDDDDLRRYRPHPGAKRTKPNDEGLVAGLRWAKDFPEHLSGFEVEFIASVLASAWDDYDLSYKQEKVARRIIAKVKAYEGDPLV